VEVRVGIPLTGGKLVAAAREAGYPVLFSANAFFVAHGKGSPMEGDFRKFKEIDPQQFEGLDAALDSAGYVAAAKYGDYRWTPEQYLDLAAAFPWRWYASIDWCVEPGVAGDRPMRILRMAATANMVGRLNRLADIRGMPRPMPVIQGWTAAEYLECAGWMPLLEWPDLVGVGSVCRRNLSGPDGIFAILDALDARLPRNVRFHMFGVKSAALAKLAGHPRIASSDSMAWDFGARCDRRTGRDMAYRIERMHEWAEKQGEIVRAATERAAREAVAPPPPQQTMLFPPDEFPVNNDDQSLALEALAMTWADLLASSNTEYIDAVFGARRDAYPLLAQIHQLGILEATDLMDDYFDGFRNNLIAVSQLKKPNLAVLIESRLAQADEASAQRMTG